MICVKCKKQTPITYDDYCEKCEDKRREKGEEVVDATPKDRWARLHAHLLPNNGRVGKDNIQR